MLRHDKTIMALGRAWDWCFKQREVVRRPDGWSERDTWWTMFLVIYLALVGK
jgi:dolichyl-phosphate-mannose--protein O-mannosyl transferase